MARLKLRLFENKTSKEREKLIQRASDYQLFDFYFKLKGVDEWTKDELSELAEHFTDEIGALQTLRKEIWLELYARGFRKTTHVPKD